MGIRRRRPQDTDDVLAEAYDTEAETEQELVGATTDATSMPSEGPWDEADLDDPSAGRVDLGGLLIPAVQGMELRAEIADDRVIAATVVLADSAVQLQPFAAPRHQGIWDEVRGELAATVTKQGGTVDESIGPFGPELKPMRRMAVEWRTCSVALSWSAAALRWHRGIRSRCAFPKTAQPGRTTPMPRSTVVKNVLHSTRSGVVPRSPRSADYRSCYRGGFGR